MHNTASSHARPLKRSREASGADLSAVPLDNGSPPGKVRDGEPRRMKEEEDEHEEDLAVRTISCWMMFPPQQLPCPGSDPDYARAA